MEYSRRIYSYVFGDGKMKGTIVSFGPGGSINLDSSLRQMCYHKFKGLKNKLHFRC